MKVELSRLKIKAGKSERVDEWLATLNARKAECIDTLEREKVHVETIFRRAEADGDFIYWFIIQGDDPEPIETSPFPIDAIHRAFAEECIDRTFQRWDIDADVAFFAPDIAKFIGA